MKKLFAITALTIGIGAFAIPAAANDYYYGGTEYMQSQYSANAPVGEYVAREDFDGSDALAAREYLFEQKDEKHFRH